MGASTSAPTVSVVNTATSPPECPVHKQQSKSQPVLLATSAGKKGECPVQHNPSKAECPAQQSSGPQFAGECPASVYLQESIMTDDIDPTNMVSWHNCWRRKLYSVTSK